MERFAAIDIGTVTSRLLVADTDGTQVHDVARAYEVTNLGEGTDATGRLSDQAICRVMQALDGFLRLRDELSTPETPVLATRAVTTSAARDAANVADLLAVFEERGLALEVISGQQEAELTFRGVSMALPLGEPIMVVDVGGGSTEVSFGHGGQAPCVFHSFDIGCRRMTERFLAADPPLPSEMDAAIAWMGEQLRPWAATVPADMQGASLFAVAGTATSAISMQKGLAVYDPAKVHGAKLSWEKLKALTMRLAAMNEGEREHVAGLDPRRAPVITAGLLILLEVMDVFAVREFTASESDILQGMISWAAEDQRRSR